MSIIGIVILSAYLVGFLVYFVRNKLQEYSWIVFCAAIAISIFVNVGNCTKHLRYSDFAAVICIITYIIAGVVQNRGVFSIRKPLIYAVFLLVSVLLIGLLNLAVNPHMPLVMGMNTIIDLAYDGYDYARPAEIGTSNLIAFFQMGLFILMLACFWKELSDREMVGQLFDNIRKAFYIYMIAAVIEFILNNTISPRYMRDFVYSITGEIDAVKTFYPQNRFGYCGISVLYSEQSYIGLMMIYYVIVWIQGIRSNRELFWYILSMIVVLMSGCSTGVMVIPFAAIVFAREIIRSGKKTSRNLRFFEMMILLGVLVGAILLVLSNPTVFLEMMDQTIAKMNAAFRGMSSSNRVYKSGAVRNYGNSFAMNAFRQSPILGVGIGTTRGYGILSGLLANFGVLGVAALLYFVHKVVSFCLKGKWILFIILMVYISIILSVWYVYMPALIPVYLAFSKQAPIYAREAA